MRFSKKAAVVAVVLVALVLAGGFLLAGHFFNKPIVAQAPVARDFWVTINPTEPNSTFYTSAGRNWTLNFAANWTYGDNTGQPVPNATVTVTVSSARSAASQTIDVNTTAEGGLSFNYSASTADILTFTPTQLVTQDGAKYDATVNVTTSVGGLQSEFATVWYDSFHVDLLHADTGKVGETAVSVNVTYLLLPEEGLTLPSWETYNNQTFLPKIVQGATVTVNGVKAQETSPGIYNATVSAWLPTAYLFVEVSQDDWASAHQGFSVNHTADSDLWVPAIAAVLIAAVVVLGVQFASSKKSKGIPLLGKARFPMIGGVLLAVASAASLYWTVVAVDSTMHGFDWRLLAAFGCIATVFGFAGAVLSIRRKWQTVAICVVCLPLIVNLVVVESALAAYGLPIPWMQLLLALAAAILSGIVISNGEDFFTKPQQPT
jgi:hypothetical protein